MFSILEDWFFGAPGGIDSPVNTPVKRNRSSPLTSTPSAPRKAPRPNENLPNLDTDPLQKAKTYFNEALDAFLRKAFRTEWIPLENNVNSLNINWTFQQQEAAQRQFNEWRKERRESFIRSVETNDREAIRNILQNTVLNITPEMVLMLTLNRNFYLAGQRKEYIGEGMGQLNLSIKELENLLSKMNPQDEDYEEIIRMLKTLRAIDKHVIDSYADVFMDVIRQYRASS